MFRLFVHELQNNVYVSYLFSFFVYNCYTSWFEYKLNAFRTPAKIMIWYPHHFYVMLLRLTDMRQVTFVQSGHYYYTPSWVQSRYTRTGSSTNQQNCIFLMKIEFFSLDTLPDEPKFCMNKYQINRVLLYLILIMHCF